MLSLVLTTELEKDSLIEQGFETLAGVHHDIVVPLVVLYLCLTK